MYFLHFLIIYFYKFSKFTIKFVNSYVEALKKFEKFFLPLPLCGHVKKKILENQNRNWETGKLDTPVLKSVEKLGTPVPVSIFCSRL